MTDHKDARQLLADIEALNQRIAELEAERQWQPIPAKTIFSAKRSRLMSKIPQEAIQAVSIKLQPAFGPLMADKIATELLEAAMPFFHADAARAQGEDVALKPLEWEVFCGKSGNSKAKAFFDQYVVQSEKVDDLPDWRIYLPNNDHNTGIKYTTIEQAKAAAQADYEQRIRSVFTTPPAPQPADREKVLEEALWPFAERADRYNEIPGLLQFADNDELWQVAKNKGMEIDITVGDLRRARAALAGEANG